MPVFSCTVRVGVFTIFSRSRRETSEIRYYFVIHFIYRFNPHSLKIMSCNYTNMYSTACLGKGARFGNATWVHIWSRIILVLFSKCILKHAALIRGYKMARSDFGTLYIHTCNLFKCHLGPLFGPKKIYCIATWHGRLLHCGPS